MIESAKRIANVVIVAGMCAMILALAAGWTDVAKADPVPDNNPRLWVQMIHPVTNDQGVIELRTRLSNGRRDVLKPCVYEDGRHCYWVGGTHGNGRGRDFIVTAGRVFYLNLGWTQRR